MVMVRVDAIVGDDRRLVIHVPDEIPVGNIELLIYTKDDAHQQTSPTFAEAQATLRAANLLAEIEIDDEQPLLSQAELWKLTEPIQPTKQAHQQIDEDRSAR